MSRNDFAPEEFAERRQRVRIAMAEAGLDWMVCFHPVSILWLTGSAAKSFQAFQCLLINADTGRVIVFARESERAELLDEAIFDELRTWGGPDLEDPLVGFAQLAADLGMPRKRVGMEVPSFYLNPHHYVRLRDILGHALVAEPNMLVHELKMVKSPAEIAYIREAGRISDATVELLGHSLGEGRSEAELAAGIYHRMLSLGGSVPPTAVNLVSGERAAFSHGAPTQRVLRKGDSGNAEYCVAYRRYCVSVGRMFVVGKPSDRLRELYGIVREAGDAIITAVRDGVAASALYEAGSRIIAAAGLDRYRVHVVGYGLSPGFPPAAGDPLTLAPNSRYLLKSGMLLSICPPVFIAEERLGARLVDNVLVTDTGAERITRSSRDLIIVD